MTEAASPLRLRRIRYKDGRIVEVFRSKKDEPRGRYQQDRLAAASEKCLNAPNVGPDMAGWALVAWSFNGFAFCDWENAEGSGIPAGGVPQYVRDVLLADVAGRWINS